MSAAGIVIIGAGQAGAWAARTLRESGYAEALYLIGQEHLPPYERPELSKRFLLGETSESALSILGADELASIVTHFGTRVTQVDKKAKQICFADGQILTYNKLLFATGGRAYLPPIEGISLPQVYHLRDMMDARRLAEQLNKSSQRVAIVGGGWIGLELAATCRQKGHQITIFEANDRLCQRSVDQTVAAKLEQLHIKNGNAIHYKSSLHKLEQGSEGLTLYFADGRCFSADMVIVAIGMKANDELAVAAGLKTSNGILVDAYSQTSEPDIYAAGDVAVLPCSYQPQGRRHESWQNAQDQGIAVAKSMLSERSEYKPSPMLWSEQFDVRLQLYGYIDQATKTLLRQDSGSGDLFFYINDENKIIGVVAWNNSRDYRAARQLVDQCRSVPFDLLRNTEVPLIKIAKG